MKCQLWLCHISHWLLNILPISLMILVCKWSFMQLNQYYSGYNLLTFLEGPGIDCCSASCAEVPCDKKNQLLINNFFKVHFISKWNCTAFVLSVLTIRLLFENQVSNSFITLFSLACTASISLYIVSILISSAKRINFALWIIIIGIQPLGRSGQRPEFSQATGMALVRCFLGKFLGVVCHCFPPLFFRCSHFSPPGASTSATMWEIPVAEVGTVGENVVR